LSPRASLRTTWRFTCSSGTVARSPDRHRNEHLRADANPPGLIRSIRRRWWASWPQVRSSLRSSGDPPP
jgi:hypothetical protein